MSPSEYRKVSAARYVYACLAYFNLVNVQKNKIRAQVITDNNDIEDFLGNLDLNTKICSWKSTNDYTGLMEVDEFYDDLE